MSASNRLIRLCNLFVINGIRRHGIRKKKKKNTWYITSGFMYTMNSLDRQSSLTYIAGRLCWIINEPTHEVMVLVALRKLNLQTRMHSDPLRLHVWYLVRHFVYFNTLCVRTAKALSRLRGCAVLIEPSLFAYAISTIFSRAGFSDVI